jgi:hypothetical protein
MQLSHKAKKQSLLLLQTVVNAEVTLSGMKMLSLF